MSDLEMIYLYAFRYCLGRSSYCVQDYITYMMGHLNELSENARCIMFKEINEAEVRNGLGDNINTKSWIEFKNKIMDKIDAITD